MFDWYDQEKKLFDCQGRLKSGLDHHGRVRKTGDSSGAETFGGINWGRRGLIHKTRNLSLPPTMRIRHACEAIRKTMKFYILLITSILSGEGKNLQIFETVKVYGLSSDPYPCYRSNVWILLSPSRSQPSRCLELPELIQRPSMRVILMKLYVSLARIRFLRVCLTPHPRLPSLIHLLSHRCLSRRGLQSPL
jgi:hypothetical protein